MRWYINYIGYYLVNGSNYSRPYIIPCIVYIGDVAPQESGYNVHVLVIGSWSLVNRITFV